MRRFLNLPIAVLAAMSLFSSAALAHPGHGGGFAEGLAHPLHGLDHVLAMVAVGLWAAQLGRPCVWLLPAVFPLVMAGGAMMGANGIALPYAEAGIVASLIVLGLAVALRWRSHVAVSAGLVGLFALFHGYAHGTEFGGGESALLYGAGFIVATMFLHAIGLAIGFLANRPVVMRTAGGAIAAVGVLFVATL